MANTTISPNMQLPIPVAGEDAGPDYADNVNNCLTLVDQHDHSPGYGVQITPSGIDINGDLSMQANNLVLARSVRFSAQGSPLGGASDLGCLYESGVDLYYNDGIGNQVRITQSGGVAGSPGSIANLTSPASASYVSANQTFVWQSDASTPANMDGASYILRNLVANSKGLTLAPPAAMASDYSITLPSLPASTLPMSIDASGNISAAQITLAQLQTAIQQALTPTGSITAYGAAAAPTGWLLCDGSLVSRSTYSALFAVIGVAYGSGNGSTTFAVPDFRGQFLRGVSGTSGNDPDASSRTASGSGGATGNNVGSGQSDQFKAHTHTVPTHPGASTGTNTMLPNSDSNAQTGSSPASSSAGGTETRPKNIYVNFIIKT